MAKKANTSLSVSTDSLSKAIDAEFEVYTVRIKNKIASMLEKGVAKDVIYASLSNDVVNGVAEFGMLLGAIESQIDEGIFSLSNEVSNAVISEETDQFIWEWEPGVEHCDTCSERNGQIKSYQEWQDLGLPGAGTTDCGIYCKCTLLPHIEK